MSVLPVRHRIRTNFNADAEGITPTSSLRVWSIPSWARRIHIVEDP
jgi:hypothetical protein